MKRYLSGSLCALSVATIVGFLVHTPNRSSSVAHANLGIAAPISPLAQLADSLRTLTLSLDARIMEIHAIDSTLVTHLELPVMSAALDEMRNPMPAPPEGFFGPVVLLDAFQLNDRIALQQQHLDSVNARLQQRREIISHLPTLIPAQGTYSSNFGRRFHPIDSIWKDHEGLDIAASEGSAIHAAGNGVVTFSGTQGGYGNIVEIDHGYGYRTRYAHCSSLDAKVGDTVKRGDLIAHVGSTGHSTGPHLHFEMVIDDVKIDPLPLMRDPIVAGSTGTTDTETVTTVPAKTRKARKSRAKEPAFTAVTGHQH